MSNATFAELESEVEGLPYAQLEELQWKIKTLLSAKRQMCAVDVSGLNRYFGKVDLALDLDSLRGRDDPR